MVCLLGLFTVDAAAQDVVYFSYGRLRSESRLTGEVVDFTGKQLLIRIDDRVRKYPAQRVSRIEFRRLPEHVKADRLFAQHKFSDARYQYLKAHPAEGRKWVRRMLMAQVIWCYRLLHQFDSAGTVFLQLLLDDPDTQRFDSIPLAWLPRALPPQLERNSLAWLENEQPAAMLLGASHLLMSRHRAVALEKLKTLRFHKDPRISGLARAQIWRASLAAAVLRDVEEWRSEMEKIPEPLRAGAYYILGSGLARTGESEDAVLAMLRVPLLYAKERNLAARCLLDAARELEKMRRPREAARLNGEVVADYPDTQDAALAKERLPSRGN